MSKKWGGKMHWFSIPLLIHPATPQALSSSAPPLPPRCVATAAKFLPARRSITLYYVKHYTYRILLTASMIRFQSEAEFKNRSIQKQYFSLYFSNVLLITISSRPQATACYLLMEIEPRDCNQHHLQVQRATLGKELNNKVGIHPCCPRLPLHL